MKDMSQGRGRGVCWMQNARNVGNWDDLENLLEKQEGEGL